MTEAKFDGGAFALAVAESSRLTMVGMEEAAANLAAAFERTHATLAQICTDTD